MARLPRPLPRWNDTIYGGDEDAWEEAKSQCAHALRAWAAAGRYGTYTDLTQRVRAIDWPDGPHTHEGNQMGYLLGQVSIAELDATTDRPLLSALVVEKESGRPSHGFWSFCRDLGLADVVSTEARRDEFWLGEVQRCWDMYRASKRR
jgi:hypothetical protein